MSLSFWSLVSFEYKKIFNKRSVQFALLLTIAVIGVSVFGTLFGNTYIDGKVFESNYDAMSKNRDYARALDGRQIDSELIMESAQAYARVSTQNYYTDTDEYQRFARPYSGVYSVIRTIFNTESHRFNMKDFQKLTEEQADDFYTMRRHKQIQLVQETNMSSTVKERILAMDAKIEVPFTFSYTDGYRRFFNLSNIVGLASAFAIASCIAPLFAGEYTSGTDQLILSSRHGKNKLISAKLFTGFSLTATICVLLITMVYFLSMLIFGSDGGNAPLQLYAPMSPYPLVMKQAALFLAVCVLLSCFMVAAITMFLSAGLKSPFGVIVLISLLLVVPMFIHIPMRNIGLYNLMHLLPTNMIDFWNITDGIQYELFGLIIKPYIFMPLFAGSVSILLTPFAYHSFKNHQIV